MESRPRGDRRAERTRWILRSRAGGRGSRRSCGTGRPRRPPRSPATAFDVASSIPRPSTSSGAANLPNGGSGVTTPRAPLAGGRAPPAGRRQGGCVGRRERDDARRRPAGGRGDRAADEPVLEASADRSTKPSADRHPVAVRPSGRRGAGAEGERPRPRCRDAGGPVRQGRQAAGRRGRRGHGRARRSLDRTRRSAASTAAPSSAPSRDVRWISPTSATCCPVWRGKPGWSGACTRTASATPSRSKWSAPARRSTSSGTRSATPASPRPPRCT